MPRFFSWLMSCTVLVLLTACTDFDEEFAVQSAKSAVVVSKNGTALVSESFDVLARKRWNYGGVYVDIPQRFKDASGAAHWRDFSFVDARRDGDSSYYNVENELPGHSIYIGGRRCRSCHPDLPLGINNIEITYRLGRLVRQEGGRQVLFLPAYMGRVHGQGAKKTVSLRIPPGGVLRLSSIDQAAYDITQSAPTEVVVSIPAGEKDRVLPDIEIEYPGGTFRGGTNDNLWRWWLSDHLLLFLSVSGPLIACLSIAFGFRDRWRPPPAVTEICSEMTESISPALAAYLFLDWKMGAAKSAFMASVCHLAMKRKLRISCLAEDADASDLSGKRANAKRKVTGARWYSLPNATRLVFERIEKQRPVDEKHRIIDAWHGSGDELHRAAVAEYQQVGGGDGGRRLATVAAISALGLAIPYFSGLIAYSAAICAVLAIPFTAVSMFWQPERFSVPTGAMDRFKQAITIFFGFPVGMVIAVLYVANTEVTVEQQPYLVAILLNIVSSIAVIAIPRMPTQKQRRVRNNMAVLKRYLLGELAGPDLSTECYEHYLPFAVALGVEQHWTKRFNLWRESEKMDAYAPDWLKRS